MNITNKQIAAKLAMMARLMELHEANTFKVKSYEKAAETILEYEAPLATMSAEEWLQIKGIGKSMAAHIGEITATGSFSELDALLTETPPGLPELLRIKGLTPAKVMYLWKDYGIKDLNSLVEALDNGALNKAKGFSAKFMATLRDSIEFFYESKGRVRIHEADYISGRLAERLAAAGIKAEITGAVRRRDLTTDSIDFLVPESVPASDITAVLQAEGDPSGEDAFILANGLAVRFHRFSHDSKGIVAVQCSALPRHLSMLPNLPEKAATEKEVYDKLHLPFIIPEMRRGTMELERMKEISEDDIISMSDIKGCVHNHSVWSDGSVSIREMAEACTANGLEYFGIADHSRYAAYAGGLKPEQVYAQWEEIAELQRDAGLKCKLLAGTECDILPDGNLDYDDELLAGYDYVVASVHSQLNMDIDTATKRIIRAVENPYTSILGHLSGRILLERRGYSLHYDKVLDACAANGVMIELNSSPYRMDIDSRYLYDVLARGIMISINPDAHSTGEIPYMKWGVFAARSAGITPKEVFNCLSFDEALRHLRKKNPGKR